MGLASSAGLSPLMEKPVISIGGDGGFWHSSLTSGVASYVFNKGSGILVLLKNGYVFVKGNDDIHNWKHGPIDDFYIHNSVTPASN
jgi:indolepyruvate ferredoxin oxidoreductase alpha subunit